MVEYRMRFNGLGLATINEEYDRFLGGKIGYNNMVSTHDTVVFLQTDLCPRGRLGF